MDSTKGELKCSVRVGRESWFLSSDSHSACYQLSDFDNNVISDPQPAQL